MQTEDMQTVDIAGALSSVTQRGHAGLAGPGRAVPGELAVGDEVRRGGSAAGNGGAGTPAGDPGDVSAALAGAPSSRGTYGDGLHAVVSPQSGKTGHDAVTMPAALCLRLLGQAARIHRAGLKSYGLLIAEPGAAGYPFTATDVVFLDSRKNRRNDPGHRVAFQAQGEYFRQFDDAGFVADPAELPAVCRAIEEAGAQIVAPFHSHRRQPANFSLIDYRLHNPAFAWHLIISLRDPRRPVLQPFGVQKDWSDFGISDQDAGQGSELAYPGPEVAPLNLIAHGAHPAIHQLASTLGLAGRPKTRPTAATGRARPHTLALSPAGAARAATTTVTYTLATAAVAPVTAACDTPPCPVISYTFAGPGTTTSAAVPASGNFTWTFTPSKSSNSNPCAFTQGTGTLDVTWADATTTEVTFAFKARDSHSWALKGEVTAGSNTFYPPNPITPASGAAGIPTDPCTGGPVAATISLTPPSPI